MKINGFTLIEMLLTIAILLLIGSISSPFFSRFLLQNNVANVTDQVTGQIRKAQFYAMMGKNNGSWGVIVNSGALILFQGSDFTVRNNAFDETFLINPNNTVGGLGELIFSKSSGLPNNTPTIIISGNGTSKTIKINSQGIINGQ